MNKISNFVKSTLAFFTGDTDKQIALANERKAFASFNSRISELEYRIVDAEEEVREAKINLAKAIHPTHKIDTGNVYLHNILASQKEVEKAAQKLKDFQTERAMWVALREGEETQVAEEN